MVPALPLPGTRRREPLRAPGGMRTSTVSVWVTRPSPPQVGQALRSLPEPPHRGQVRLNFMAPAIWVTCAGAFALRAGDFAGAGGAGAVAGVADVVAGDVEARLRAFDGLPEIDIHHVLEVAALFGLGVRRLRRRVRRRTARRCRGSRRRPPLRAGARRVPAAPVRTAKSEKSKPLKSNWEPRLPPPPWSAGPPAPAIAVLRIEAELVVHAALLGVAQDVVGFLHVLETVLGGLVPGFRSG